MKALLAFALGVTLTAATVAAQSLADVAKRTEEERAKTASKKDAPTKVITNDDLKKDPNAPAPAPDEKPKTATSKPAAKKESEKAEPKQNEAAWKRRATELHVRLAEDERAAAAGRERVAQLQRNVDAIGCIGCKQTNQLQRQLWDLQETQAKLDAKVANDKAAIQEFEEEGRRAGILPGWLRPQ